MMKKLLAFALVAMLASAAMASTWYWDGGSYAYTWDSISQADAFYDLDQAYQSANLDGANLGTFDITADSLYLNGEINVGSDEGDAFTAAGLVWRVNGGDWTWTTVDPTLVEGQHYRSTVSGIDLIAAGQVDVNTLDVLAVRQHAWDGGSYTSYMGYDTANATEILTEGVDPIGMPTSDFFTATYTLTAIPEPATMSLLGLGALAMVLRRKISK